MTKYFTGSTSSDYVNIFGTSWVHTQGVHPDDVVFENMHSSISCILIFVIGPKKFKKKNV